MDNNKIVANDQKKGHVKNVCKEILVKEDESLAHKLQNQEFHTHYALNRKERRSIRTDIPIAKTIQSREYEEQLRRHQLLEQLEKEDELIAHKEQQRLMDEINNQIRQQQLADEEYARTLQKSIMKACTTSNGPGMASDSNDSCYNDKEYLKKLQEQDSQIARYLQEQEKRRIKPKPANIVKDTSIDEDERLARMLQEEENLQYQRERTSRQQNTEGYEQLHNFGSTHTHANKTVQGPFLIDENQLISLNRIQRRVNPTINGATATGMDSSLLSSQIKKN